MNYGYPGGGHNAPQAGYYNNPYPQNPTGDYMGYPGTQGDMFGDYGAFPQQEYAENGMGTTSPCDQNFATNTDGAYMNGYGGVGANGGGLARGTDSGPMEFPSDEFISTDFAHGNGYFNMS